MIYLGGPGVGISGNKEYHDWLKTCHQHLTGIDIVDVMVDKDASIKVAVQDETRDTVNEDLGKKETGKIPGENLTDHPPNNVF